MPDITVEEAVKQNCQALLIGDLMRVMNDLTPEAMAQLMSGGGNMGAMPALTGFDIKNHQVTGEDHVFKIAFKGDQDFTALATWRDVGGAWKIAALAMEQPMTADTFMRDHADKASTGRIAEVIGDLTPEAMSQLGPLMAGAPNPVTANTVKAVSDDGTDYLFDVTYTGNGEGKLSMRETVRQIEGVWKIVKLAAPA